MDGHVWEMWLMVWLSGLGIAVCLGVIVASVYERRKNWFLYGPHGGYDEWLAEWLDGNKDLPKEERQKVIDERRAAAIAPKREIHADGFLWFKLY